MNKIERLIQELCPEGVEWKKLGEIGNLYGGLTGKSKEDFREGNAKFISYLNIYSNPSTDLNISDKVFVKEGENQNAISYGDVLFTGSSETPDECAMSSVVNTPIEDEKIYLNSFSFGFRPFNLSDFDVNYLKHLFRSSAIRKIIFKTSSGVTRFNVSKERFIKIPIPIPPIAEQERIAQFLDKMEKMTSDLREGLPAEIAARHAQYIYYREQLLNFKKRA